MTVFQHFSVGDRVMYVGDPIDGPKNGRGQVVEVKNPSFWGPHFLKVRWSHTDATDMYKPSQLKKYRFKESEQLGMEV